MRRGESRGTFAPWVGDLNHEHPYIDIDDDLGDGEESSMHFPSIDRKDIQFPNQSQKTMHESIGLTEIALWHDRLLKWAATKTTGLGINAGYGKTQGKIQAIVLSVAFDIQPFFPSFELMPLIMYRLIRLSKEALGDVLVALSNTNSESLKSLRSTVRKRKYENKWMQKDDDSMDRLYRNKSQTQGQHRQSRGNVASAYTESYTAAVGVRSSNTVTTGSDTLGQITLKRHAKPIKRRVKEKKGGASSSSSSSDNSNSRDGPAMSYVPKIEFNVMNNMQIVNVVLWGVL